MVEFITFESAYQCGKSNIENIEKQSPSYVKRRGSYRLRPASNFPSPFCPHTAARAAQPRSKTSYWILCLFQLVIAYKCYARCMIKSMARTINTNKISLHGKKCYLSGRPCQDSPAFSHRCAWAATMISWAPGSTSIFAFNP